MIRFHEVSRCHCWSFLNMIASTNALKISPLIWLESIYAPSMSDKASRIYQSGTRFSQSPRVSIRHRAVLSLSLSYYGMACLTAAPDSKGEWRVVRQAFIQGKATNLYFDLTIQHIPNPVLTHSHCILCSHVAACHRSCTCSLLCMYEF